MIHILVLQISCNCVGCSSGPPTCSPDIGEILPSAAPAPSIVTVENLSVSSSLLPPEENHEEEEYTEEDVEDEEDVVPPSSVLNVDQFAANEEHKGIIIQKFIFHTLQDVPNRDSSNFNLKICLGHCLSHKY